MQAIRTHVAGIDVHKDVLAITVLIGGEGEEEDGSTKNDCERNATKRVLDDLKKITRGYH